MCPTECTVDGIPLHLKACKHNDQAPSVHLSKVRTNKSVPLVEQILVGKSYIGIQYDTGCQLSLISPSTLSSLPPSMYSLGPSSRVRVLTYAGEGKDILTTEVKLKLHGKTLKLSTIEEDLNNGSEFSLSIPHKWRSFMGTSTSHHTGQISILLGGDNHLFFPTEVVWDSQGMALYQSNLTQSYMVYVSVPSNTITWVEPIISFSNRIRRRTRQAGRKTGGEAETSGRNREENQEIQEKNQDIRTNRRKIRNFMRKSGGESGTPGRNQEENQEIQEKNQGIRKRNRRKSGGESGTSVRNREENQEIQEKNQDIRKRNRRRTRNFRKKSEGEPTPELPANLNPPQETIQGLAEDHVAAELAQEQSNQLHPAQDEFHADPASTEQ